METNGQLGQDPHLYDELCQHGETLEEEERYEEALAAYDKALSPCT